jgi:hypothetical protein
MVPHIPVIAMTVAETLPATSSFDASIASQGLPLDAHVSARLDAQSDAQSDAHLGPQVVRAASRRAQFDDGQSSAGDVWLADFEASRNAAAADLDAQVRRAASGSPLQVADALRLRHDLNTHTETVMLAKKVSDALTNGLQTLARGN